MTHVEPISFSYAIIQHKCDLLENKNYFCFRKNVTREHPLVLLTDNDEIVIPVERKRIITHNMRVEGH